MFYYLDARVKDFEKIGALAEGLGLEKITDEALQYTRNPYGDYKGLLIVRYDGVLDRIVIQTTPEGHRNPEILETLKKLVKLCNPIAIYDEGNKLYNLSIFQ